MVREHYATSTAMHQFDVLDNPIPRARRTMPFVVILQSDLAETGHDRVVAPLAPSAALPTTGGPAHPDRRRGGPALCPARPIADGPAGRLICGRSSPVWRTTARTFWPRSTTSSSDSDLRRSGSALEEHRSAGGLSRFSRGAALTYLRSHAPFREPAALSADRRCDPALGRRRRGRAHGDRPVPGPGGGAARLPAGRGLPDHVSCTCRPPGWR